MGSQGLPNDRHARGCAPAFRLFSWLAAFAELFEAQSNSELLWAIGLVIGYAIPSN